MLVFLAAGIILGAVSVIFLLQNVAMVTVSFMTWQISASLAIVLFGALLCGIIIMSLVLIPSLIRDGAYLSSIKRQKRELENELAQLKAAAAKTPVEVVTPVPEQVI